MTNETLNRELLDKASMATTAEELQAVVEEAGSDITLEEAGRIISAKQEAGDGEELTDNQLDAATGGVAWTEMLFGIMEGFLGK